MAGSKLSKASRKLIGDNVHPIVEMFPVDFDEQSEKSFLCLDDQDKRQLREHLKETKGIYAFYNSEFEIIYLGKTKSSLWNEMKVAFNREMSDYKRFQVYHPSETYKATSGKVRFLQRRWLRVYDCARYFSAYSVRDETLIDLLEMMIIRVCANDILNVRMEGNHTLRPYWVE